MPRRIPGDKYREIDRIMREIMGELDGDGFVCDPSRLIATLQDVRDNLHNGLLLRVIKAWKTVEIGTFQSCESALNLLAEGEYQVSGHSRSMMRQIDFAQRVEEIGFTLLATAEIGHLAGIDFSGRNIVARQVLDAIDSIDGIEHCPAEVGPALRIQESFIDPRNTPVYVAMTPIEVEEYGACIFYCWFQSRSDPHDMTETWFEKHLSPARTTGYVERDHRWAVKVNQQASS